MPNPNTPLPPCPSGIYWIVAPGDTLYMISKRMDVSLDALIKANPGVNPQNLKIDSKICIPK